MDLVGKIVPYLKGKRADYFTKKSLDKIWKDTSNSCKLKKLSKSQISDIQKYWYDRTGKKYQQNGINYFILLLENLKLNMNHLKYV